MLSVISLRILCIDEIYAFLMTWIQITEVTAPLRFSLLFQIYYVNKCAIMVQHRIHIRVLT
jgi:hypothetical protein